MSAIEGVLAGLLGGLSAGAGAEANYYADEIKQRRLENFEALKQKYAKENTLLKSNEQVANQEYLNEQASELKQQEAEAQSKRDLEKMREEYGYKEKIARIKASGTGGNPTKELINVYYKPEAANYKEKIKRYEDEYKALIEELSMQPKGKKVYIPSKDEFMYSKLGRKDWQNLTNPVYLLQMDKKKESNPEEFIEAAVEPWDYPINTALNTFSADDLGIIRELRRNPYGRVVSYGDPSYDPKKSKLLKQFILEKVKQIPDKKLVKEDLEWLEKKGWFDGPDAKDIINMVDSIIQSAQDQNILKELSKGVTVPTAQAVNIPSNYLSNKPAFVR